MRSVMMGAVAVLALGACSNTMSANGASDGATGDRGAAQAALRTAAGADVGTATLFATRDGLIFKIAANGLPVGDHGIHIHATGKCEAPKFESAGPHWNPTARQHGRDNPMGAHQGDLPNLTIGADGTGSVSFTVPGTMLADANGLLDADGAAFVVHAGRDDYKTDPAGASGDRIACGVFERS